MPDGTKIRQEIAPVEIIQAAQLTNTAAALTLYEGWQIFRRRKWLILFVVLLIMVCSTFAVFSLTPQYTAEASVLINDRHPPVIKAEDLAPLQPIDAEAVQTEIQVIRSRVLIGRVVDKLGLIGDP